MRFLGLAVVFSGGVNWIIGGQAERWTGEALQRFGPEWRFAHNLEFIVGDPPCSFPVDVDHVAVGPNSVVVVETKYSSDQIDLDAERLAPKVRRAAEQAHQNANRIRRLFAAMPVAPQVTSIVIYWGFRLVMPKEPIRHLGTLGKTLVVMGPDIDRWIDVVTEGQCEPQIIDEAWQRIEDYRATNTSDLVDTP